MHVVHLEDTKPLRDILYATIKALRPNCEITQFINGDEALAFIEQQGHDIDLFLLDVRVPGSISGLEVAKATRDLGCSGIIVMTSAYMSPGQEKLEQLEAYWYQKPWHVQDVQDMLQLALNNPLRSK